MKLIIASGIFPPDIGGPATYSQLIAQEFAKRGIDVAVICYSDEALNKQSDPTHQAPQTSQAFKLIRISRKHNILIRYWLYFWNLLKISRKVQRKPDSVFLVGARVAAKLKG